MKKLLGLTIGAALLSTPLYAEAVPADARGLSEAAWTAVASSGLVEARATEPIAPEWDDVERGDLVPSRAFLRTGKRGQATLTRDSNVLIVDPDSQLVLPEPRVGDGQTSVVQTAGSVVYQVDKKSSRHFSVVTPHLVAGVKGTAFLVTVGQERTAVTVEHGLVEVLNRLTGEREELGPGDSVFLEKGEGRLERFGVEDRAEPRVRNESKRLDRMARRTRASLDRSPNGRYVGLPGGGALVDGHATTVAGTTTAGNAFGGKDVAGTDVAGKASVDWRSYTVAGETAWEQQIDLVDGKRAGVVGKPLPPKEVDPVPLPDPGDPGGPTGVGGGGGRGNVQQVNNN